jgi:hypothetical protein
MLYRAFAYQLQPLETFSPDVQPEVMVFFESHTPEAASATLLRTLALAWGCTPADVDFYNLVDEQELRRDWGSVAPGDAALWVTGHCHGPLFQPVDRTLMFVRPLTLRRLLLARQATAPLRRLQVAAAREADQRKQREQRQRHGFMAEMSRMLSCQPRAGD